VRGRDGNLILEFHHDKTPQDYCGVFGVWPPGEVVTKPTDFGIYVRQPLGKETTLHSALWKFC